MRGEKIAPAEITLLDDPRHAGARVRLETDDEGTRAGTKVLVEEGVLRTFLTDRATARASGGLSTGSARRDSYRHPPLPRMTNLVLRSGARDPEEMRREIGRGLLVETLGRGQVDPRRGEFRLEVTSGRLIEEGELGRAVASAYIVGSCRDLLASIDGVGADVTIDPGAGVCIKDDQIVPVGQATPSIRASRLRVLPGAGA
jgi:TldD protein